jgi:hypothetical protein
MTILSAPVERMELEGMDRVRYFMPTAICLYLSVLCALLVGTAAFLASVQNAVAVAATGAFGLLLSVGLGLLLWRAQRRELEYFRVPTAADPAVNFDAVQRAVARAGWRIASERPGHCLEARTRLTLLDVGERVVVQFRGPDVLIASICEPSVGFSLVGRRHCAAHRELVRAAVQAATPDGAVDK